MEQVDNRTGQTAQWQRSGFSGWQKVVIVTASLMTIADAIYDVAGGFMHAQQANRTTLEHRPDAMRP